MKKTRTYKVGKRTAKNYNEWMEYIHKEISKNKIKLKLNKNAKSLQHKDLYFRSY